MQGIVTDIQRFSVHDGPGIRTTVFLKGCNMRCAWCHNPETLRAQPELQFFPEPCIGCGACATVCPHGAQVMGEGSRQFLRERCQACGACARGCYAEALMLVGRTMTAEAVLAEVAQDRDFYRNSGGGVTISGGEPLLQREFTAAILARCRDEGIATAIETNLAGPWEHLAGLLPLVDLVMADLKLLDEARHVAWTGIANTRILANARRLAEQPVPLIIRTPVIPGVNDTPEEIGGIAAYIAGFANLLYYELLPFHPLGSGKYQSLGLEYRTAGVCRPNMEQVRALADLALQHGIPVRIAGVQHGT